MIRVFLLENMNKPFAAGSIQPLCPGIEEEIIHVSRDLQAPGFFPGLRVVDQNFGRTAATDEEGGGWIRPGP